MELRQLEYALAVAEQLNFGRAAEQLHVGQPAISQQVRRLERELGVELFDRSSRHVALTSAGERFVVEARAVLAAVERARTSVRARPGRTLRLGTSSGLGDRLARLVERLASTAPDLVVELLGASTSSRLEQVRTGRLDAAFVRGVDAVVGLDLVHVWDDQVVVAIGPGSPLAGQDPLPLMSLSELPLRIVERAVNPPLVDLIVGACARAGFAPRRWATAGRLGDTLAMLGSRLPSWTVLYAAQARELAGSRAEFRRTDPKLSMPTACVFSPDAPAALITPLLEACVAIDHES